MTDPFFPAAQNSQGGFAPTNHPPSPPPGFTPPTMAQHAPGRPPRDPESRAASDERYNKMKEVLQHLPEEATDYRFAIYLANQSKNGKNSTKKLGHVLFAKWKSEGFKDNPEALKSYLQSKFGDGRYWIEPQDARHCQIPQLPGFLVSTFTQDEEDDMTQDMPSHNHPRARGRFPRSYTMDDTEDFDLLEDDPIASRANIADALAISAKSTAKQQELAMQTQQKGLSDTLSMMMMMQQQQAQAAAEQRRADSEREERRREEERKREDERKREEDRKYQERIEAQRREDDRRRDEIRQMQDASNKRMEMMLGIVTAAIPVVQKVFEKKDDPVMATMLAKMSQEKPQDPMTVMLMKHVLDKGSNQDGMQTLIQGMAQVNQMTGTIMQEQMKNALTMSNEMNQRIIQHVLDTAMQGEDDEKGGGTLGKIVEAVKAASDMVGTLTGGASTALPPAPLGRMLPAPAPAPSQPPGQAQPAQSPAPATPQGIEAVCAGLMALQTRPDLPPAHQQHLVAYMVQEMPETLKAAILAQDEGKVIEQCMPVFTSNAELMGWISQAGVIDWIRAFLPQLVPALQAAPAEAPTGPGQPDTQDMPQESTEVDDLPEN